MAFLKKTTKGLGFFLIAVFGLAYLFYSYTNAKKDHEDTAFQIAKTAAATIHIDELKKLEVDARDINKSEYKLLHKNLVSTINVNTKAEFAYIFTKKNGQLYCMVGSQPINSKDYIAPGTKANFPEPVYYEIIKSGRATIGYSKDISRNKWVSIFVPIKDPKTQKTIAVFAMDYNYNVWYYPLFYQVAESIAIILLLFIIHFFSLKITTKNRSIQQQSEHLKIADQQLKDRDARFNEIIGNMSDVLYQINPNGTIIEISPNIFKHIGYTREELIGTDISRLYETPADRDILLNSIKQNGEIKDYILKFNTKDNSQIYISVNATLMFDANNNPTHINGIARDITERKKTEKKLIESENLLRTIIDNQAECIKIVDSTGNLVMMNPAGIEMIEAGSLEDVKGACVLDLITPEFKKAFSDLHKQVITGNQVKLEFELQGLNGTKRWMETSAVPMILNGETVHLAHTRDISERKIVEQELRIAKEKAEESERLKTAFLANMSHEIRTPMNGILGFTELLKEPNLSGEKQQEYINIIRKSGNRMLNIINDIIDISKIESGVVKVSKSKICINEINLYIQSFFKHEAFNEGIQLYMRNGLPNDAAIIKSDKQKITNILTNLVKNALKFTHKGSIEFGYNLNTETNELEYFVKDTGDGIDSDMLEIIFERFRQTSETTSKNYEGAGLGLAITKSFVEILGGKIWVESELGKGSTFYFTLPYDPELISNRKPKIREVNIGLEEPKDLKILLAEDDEISAKLLEISVKGISKTVLRARNGLEAVELALNNPDLDLILMDIQMPQMDGYQATEEIRKFNPEIIIIAQSAFAFSDDIQKAENAGCDGHISKPVKKVELMKVINKHFMSPVALENV